MTTEEKAKRYDETIKKLRDMMPNWERLSYNSKTFLQDLIYILPELEGSREDKTKRMLDTITYKMSQHQPDIFTGEEKEWFNDWLKKQREEKPADEEKQPKKKRPEALSRFYALLLCMLYVVITIGVNILSYKLFGLYFGIVSIIFSMVFTVIWVLFYIQISED